MDPPRRSAGAARGPPRRPDADEARAPTDLSLAVLVLLAERPDAVAEDASSGCVGVTEGDHLARLCAGARKTLHRYAARVPVAAPVTDTAALDAVGACSWNLLPLQHDGAAVPGPTQLLGLGELALSGARSGDDQCAAQRADEQERDADGRPGCSDQPSRHGVGRAWVFGHFPPARRRIITMSAAGGRLRWPGPPGSERAAAGQRGGPSAVAPALRRPATRRTPADR